MDPHKDKIQPTRIDVNLPETLDLFRYNREIAQFFTHPKNNARKFDQIKQYLIKKGISFKKVRDQYLQKRFYRRIKWLDLENCEQYLLYLQKTEKEILWVQNSLADHQEAITEVKNKPKLFQKSLQEQIVDFHHLLALFKSKGLDLSNYRQPYIEHRVFNRLVKLKLPTIKSYLNFLKTHPNEIQEFVKILAINTTQFFRNKSVWTYLEKTLFSSLETQIQEDNGGNSLVPIRILSAPCSSGEEPYSIAMIHEKLVREGNISLPIEIVALDLDNEALKMGQIGCYKENSLKSIDPYFKSRFFKYFGIHPKTKENIFALDPVIKAKVRFLPHNLFDSLHQFGKFDLIFCRNFLIYIPQEKEHLILHNMQQVLKSEGFLIIGKSDALDYPNPHRFKLFHRPSNTFWLEEESEEK